MRYAERLATDGVERGLIGPREVDRLWDRHILNSAALVEIVTEGERVGDIGSGAGLPGIPVAIARPDLEVVLIEPLLRRTTFLEEVVDELELANVRVVRGRAEDRAVIDAVAPLDVVTSRAVAPLAKLARWSLPLLREHGRMLAIKGSSVTEELERDRQELSRLGAGAFAVVRVGEGVLTEPTTVLIAELVRAKGKGRAAKRARTARRGN